MDTDHTSIIEATLSYVSPISVKSIGLLSAIYTGVIVLLMIILQIGLIWYVPLISFFMFSLYFFVKQKFMKRQTNKMLMMHQAYLTSQHPQMTCFVPVLGKRGISLYLKQASLVLENEQVFLEVFHYQSRKKLPDESIRLLLGDDFLISGLMPMPKHGVTLVESTIQDQPFPFAVVNHPTVNSCLQSQTTPIEKEVK
ncbi:MAG: hypothetical protein WC351_03440 [Candidatus Izemoplasmatales bacterium]|jgi:hypothetical protein